MKRTITLQANGTYTLTPNARVFAVISASAPFDAEVDQDGVTTMATDRKLGNPGGQPIKRIVFYETSGADNQITFWTGDQDFVTNVASNTGSSSVVVVPSAGSMGYPFATVSNTPGAPVPLKAASTKFRHAKLVARQNVNGLAIVVNAGNVVLGSGNPVAGQQGFVLQPGDEITLDAPPNQYWDFNKIYMDVVNAGDGVAVVFWSN